MCQQKVQKSGEALNSPPISLWVLMQIKNKIWYVYISKKEPGFIFFFYSFFPLFFKLGKVFLQLTLNH